VPEPPKCSERARQDGQSLAAELDEARTAAASGHESTPIPVDTDVATLAAAAVGAQERRAELAAIRDQLREAWQAAQSGADAIDFSQRGAGYQLALLEARRDQLRVALTGDRESLGRLEPGRLRHQQGG